MIRVTHIITDLAVGGAEMMLLKLLATFDSSQIQSEVISLTEVGPIGERIRELGIQVQALGMRPGAPKPRDLRNLVRLIRETKPDVVQTWMHHSNFLGGIASRVAGPAPLLWNIRQANLDWGVNKPSLLLIARLCGMLSSRIPDRIVCCSYRAQTAHEKFGFRADKITVIPNGFDVTAFTPSPSLRQKVRTELGFSDSDFVVGLVGRFDAQKDQRNFLEAASLLLPKVPTARFVLCGEAITWDNPVLSGWVDELGLRSRTHLLGRRNDLPALNSAFDIASTSSCGEGFPNVVGEAMATGIACVVTDVGDSAFLVGETGLVVPPKDPNALALAWQELFSAGPSGRDRMGRLGRDRVKALFSLESVTARYYELYRETAASKNQRSVSKVRIPWFRRFRHS